MTLEGDNRRKNFSDHDLLISIHSHLEDFILRFSEHAESDKAHFERHDRSIDFINKQIWIATGIIMATTFLLNYFVKKGG